MTPIERLGINVIKALSMDAPHAARSGHQGTAMALAPLAHVLWTRVMRYDAQRPDWPDRDRFVLSAGHASILQYAMLYLTGHGLTLDDIKDFRQWGSATPGHPEAGCTPGVEVTTGPLGQGIANAVGMAIAESQLRTRFGIGICDHRIFVIAGDGDLSEGVSHEAASLAGHLGLGRLVVVYDDNEVTIDGGTDLALSDDAATRFRSYGWHVIELGEAAEDLDALESGLRDAAADEDRPSLVILRSVIAAPAPQASGTPAAHGYAIFDEEIAATKKLMGLPADESFHVPSEVVDYYRDAGTAGQAERFAWEARAAAFDGDRSGLEACLAATGRPGWEEALPAFEPGQSVATRKASNVTLQALLPEVPGLTGGGADLTGNTGTVLADSGVFSAGGPGGRQIYFGVREHAMGAVANGMALHGGAIPVVGTFLVFADYMRPAVRLAALSEAKVVFVWSHDSVGVGEDGPTHQPVEHVASLRAIPDLTVIRPADATETVGAWRVAVESGGPTALILTRQGVPVLEGTLAESVAAGGYTVLEPDEPSITLVGTGSEVSVCCDAADLLAAEGISARVVSLPSWELFAQQPYSEQARVLRPDLPSLSVEAGTTMGWSRWTDEAVGIDRFGASAPGAQVMEKLGISAPNVATRARALVEGSMSRAAL
ncbi:MAG: transketolase [Acidimicrobiaceae bacterium]|nr:transketolase [Acidimicrobiaceae bacterium]